MENHDAQLAVARAACIEAARAKQAHALLGGSWRPDGSYDLAYIEESFRLSREMLAANRKLAELRYGVSMSGDAR